MAAVFAFLSAIVLWVFADHRRKRREAIIADACRDIAEADKHTIANREALHYAADKLRTALVKCDRIKSLPHRKELSVRIDRVNEQLRLLDRVETLRGVIDPLSRTPSGRNVERMADLPDDPADWPPFIIWPSVPSDKLDAYLRYRGIKDERVLAAMLCLRLADFRPWELQTEPLQRARIIEQLDVHESDNVLHVGTGSGVDAALLSRLARSVVTIEIHPTLAIMSQMTFEHLEYRNISAVTGDGRLGYAQSAPFDVIFVAAAVDEIPPELWRQLANGGRMAIPIASAERQELRLIRKVAGRSGVFFDFHCECDLLQ